MNELSTISNRRHGLKRVFLICFTLAFGAVCFFAGRISVQPTDSAGANTASNAVAALTNTGETDAAVLTTIPKAKSKASVRWDEQEWAQLTSKPGTGARNNAMAELLEKLAATDPKRAMSLAQAEGNLKLRANLQQAVLRGWATTAPADAAKWALALPNQSDRSASISTVFASAVATDPEKAVRTAKLVMEQEPGGDIGYGSSLIDALCDAGHFERAAKFANDGDPSQRSFWLGEAYSKWAGLQPEQAAQAASAIADPDIRNEALHGVVGGWSEADPAALSQFLAQQPPGGDRGSMLGQSLFNWVKLDPVAAATWINNNNDLGDDLDEAIKAVANIDLSSDYFKPDTAVNWAESIHNEKIRSEALATVLQDWAHTDLAAAKSFFDTTTNLLAADRQRIAEMIADMSRNAE